MRTIFGSEFSLVGVVSSLILLACIVYLAYAMLADENTNPFADNMDAIVQTSSRVSSAVGQEAGGGQLVDASRPPVAGLATGHPSATEQAVASENAPYSEPYSSAVAAAAWQTGPVSAIDRRSGVPQGKTVLPSSLYGLPVSAGVADVQESGVTFPRSVATGRAEAPTSPASAHQNEESVGLEPLQAEQDSGQTSGAYNELVAEVQVDIDEVQKVRCYPVSNQDSTPCMCELTIIKEGQTQSELIDNCNN